MATPLLDTSRPIRTITQVLLLVFGFVVILIAIAHIAVGTLSIPGGGDVNGTIDSEMRFGDVLLLAYGAALVWCVRDVERKRTQVDLLALIFFAGGLSRLIAIAETGMPNAFFTAMMVLELVLSVIVFALNHKVERSQ